MISFNTFVSGAKVIKKCCIRYAPQILTGLGIFSMGAATVCGIKTAPKAKKWDEEATEYAVYRFNKGEKVNIDDASHLIAITRDTFLQLPYATGKQHYTYVVTFLNRLHSESKIAKKKVKL